MRLHLKLFGIWGHPFHSVFFFTPTQKNHGVKSFILTKREKSEIKRFMSRPIRIEYPGAVYHVACGGNERSDFLKTTGIGNHLWILVANQKRLKKDNEETLSTGFNKKSFSLRRKRGKIFESLFLRKRRRRVGHG